MKTTERVAVTAAYGARFSLLLAVIVVLLKTGAYLLSGSVALLSDAAESLVNIAAALALMVSLRVAKNPPDYEHPYGHTKAEYLSSALEGALILLAALGIIVTSGLRLFDPEPLGAPGPSLAVALAATLLNGGGALYLARLARQTESAALAANARHILTDVWTSLGVGVGVVLVLLTGWLVLDPLIALGVGLHIVREGWRILSGSFSHLLDARLPEHEEESIVRVLSASPQVKGFHRLRSRLSGTLRFLEVDIFVDPAMTVGEAHDLVTRLEDALQGVLPGIISTVHVEPFVRGQREGRHLPRDEYGEDVSAP